MEINKQLFEDVLSGKLDGKFITNKYGEILSDTFRCICSSDQVMSGHYNTSDRINELFNRISPMFVDFIPDTDATRNPDVDVAKNKLTTEKSKSKQKDVSKAKQKGGSKAKKSDLITVLNAIDDLIISFELLEKRIKTIEQILCIKKTNCRRDKNGEIWKSYSQRLDLLDGEIKYFNEKSQRDKEQRLVDLSDISKSIYNVRKSLSSHSLDLRDEIEESILRYESGKYKRA